VNRRQFFRSGAAFGALLLAAPKMALSLSVQVKAAAPELPVLDYAAGCPGYEAILADLIVGFKEVYGPEIAISSDYHVLLEVVARQQCDTLCTIHRMYDALYGETAHGEQLDAISRMCYVVRKPGETDPELRQRTSDLIGQTGIHPW
jgi:hypothetical protein